MAGIYIHIPFCRKACHYCNFHFSATSRNFDEMAGAICNEATLRSGYINDSIGSIYFGGGTPSLMPATEIKKILARLNELFEIEEGAEITLEANPDDIFESNLEEWKAIGINRLSIGIQSFFEEDLLWMNRAHSAEQAVSSIELSQQKGFDNINIDLIYGTPTLTDIGWQQNVEKAIGYGIPHLSCYALTVEPKTTLYNLIKNGKFKPVSEEKQSRHFNLLMSWMKQAGYEHYEISNFSKPGSRSRHNSSYWQSKPYLGLGPSAHSFNGNSRQWNVANNAIYLKHLESGTIPAEIEMLTPVQQLNEYIMTGMRMMEGIDLNKIRLNWDDQKEKILVNAAKKYIDLGWMQLKNGHLLLLETGKHYADGIASDLFFLEG